MKAWCPRCRQVDYVNPRYVCLWCGTPCLTRTARPQYPQRRMMTVALMREAHRIHAEGGTIREAAEAIYARTRYANVRDLRLLLPRAWAALGLPYRSIRDAQVARYAKKPHPQARLDVTAEDAVREWERLGTRAAAAASLGVSPRTITNRLRRAGL